MVPPQDPPARFGLAAELGLAVAQFAPGADTAANLERIQTLTARAVGRGAHVVVFPEYASCYMDPSDPTLLEHAEGLDGGFVCALTDVARQNGVHIVAGMLERAADDPRVHNTVVAVDGRGIRARYRKQHLYDAFGHLESDWVRPGDLGAPEVFDVSGMNCGLQTCYDLRFPESTRVLVDSGVDVVLVPAQWTRGPLKEHHWRTLVQARAIENTVVVAAADHIPPQGVGCSMIVDAQGVTVGAAGTAEDVAVAVVRSSDIEAVRAQNPALRLRRYRVVAQD